MILRSIVSDVAAVEPVDAPPEPDAPAALQLKGEPWLGSLRAFRADRLKFLDAAARKGDVVGFKLGARHFHLLAHPDGVKRVLIDNAANYRKETRGQDLLKALLGEGLLTAEGEEWRSQRRMAQPAFHKDRLAAFARVMTSSTRDLLDEWAPRARSGEPFDVAEEMSRLTFRIVGLSLFGTDLADTAEVVGEALSYAIKDRADRSVSILDYIFGESWPTPANRRFKKAVSDLNAVVERTIAERRTDTSERHDLLSLFARAQDEETGARMSESLLRDQVMTILLAGHETTANALAWTWYLLSTHPAVERRLRAELESVLGSREPGFEDVPRLRYARAVIDESMRLFPPVWTLARSVVDDDVVSGKKIPGGSFVFIAPWVTHRHPDFWPNPEGFDPERFLLEAAPERPRFAYFPFGGGGRQCIGNVFAQMEATLILAQTVQRYRIELEPGHRVEPEPLITLRPRHGVRVRIRSIR